MQRGIFFLLCATFILFPLLSGSGDSKEPNDSIFCDENDFDVVGAVDGILAKIGAGSFTFPVGEETDGAIPNYSSKSASAAEVDRVINPHVNTDGRYGMVNHDAICYMSAFVTASFNIHRFREAVYAGEPETASAFMLAQVFAKIQNAKGPIITARDLMPAVQKDLNWEFGRFQCNLEFCNSFLDKVPKSVRKIFAFEVRDKYYRIDNGALLSTKITSDNTYQHVHPGSKSVIEAINHKFPVSNQVSYLIEPENCHEYVDTVPEYIPGSKLYIETRRESEIISRPEILMIGIPRTNGTDQNYNSEFINLDFEVSMPSLKKEVVDLEDGEHMLSQDEYEAPVQYLLSGFCYYVPGHYISYVRDFSKGNPKGDWYKYNDSVVTAVRTEKDYKLLVDNANTAATWAFYVRADSVRREEIEIPVPNRFLTLAKLQLALEEILDRKSKMRPNWEQRQQSSSSFLRASQPAKAGSPPVTTSPLPPIKSSGEIDEFLPLSIIDAFSLAFPLDADYHLDDSFAEVA